MFEIYQLIYLLMGNENSVRTFWNTIFLYTYTQNPKRVDSPNFNLFSISLQDGNC